MQSSFLKLSLFLLILHSVTQVSAQPPQIYIQLEDALTTQVFRYHVGDEIEIRTKAFPDHWKKSEIVDLIPEDSIIVLEEGYVKVDDILRIRRKKGKAGKIIGGSLMSLGSGILVFGTLGSLGDNSPTSAGGSAILGGLTTLIGWLISKTGRRKKFTIGKHTRLKMYDIRWPDPAPLPKT
jgi:hypothetical protein